MANIKSMDRATDKWQRVASVSQTEYKAGVSDPKTDWAQATAAAEANYNQGVQAAISRSAFGKGVKNAGTAKWQKGAIEKGATRWSEGISLSGDAYAEGFAPYRQVIANLKLPARGPKGDPKNIQRVAAVASALHDAKLKRQSGGV